MKCRGRARATLGQKTWVSSETVYDCVGACVAGLGSTHEKSATHHCGCLRRGYAVLTPWLRRADPVPTPWLRRGYAVPTPCRRRANAQYRPSPPPRAIGAHRARPRRKKEGAFRHAAMAHIASMDASRASGRWGTGAGLALSQPNSWFDSTCSQQNAASCSAVIAFFKGGSFPDMSLLTPRGMLNKLTSSNKMDGGSQQRPEPTNEGATKPSIGGTLIRRLSFRKKKSKVKTQAPPTEENHNPNSTRTELEGAVTLDHIEDYWKEIQLARGSSADSSFSLNSSPHLSSHHDQEHESVEAKETEGADSAGFRTQKFLAGERESEPILADAAAPDAAAPDEAAADAAAADAAAADVSAVEVETTAADAEIQLPTTAADVETISADADAADEDVADEDAADVAASDAEAATATEEAHAAALKRACDAKFEAAEAAQHELCERLSLHVARQAIADALTEAEIINARQREQAVWATSLDVSRAAIMQALASAEREHLSAEVVEQAIAVAVVEVERAAAEEGERLAALVVDAVKASSTPIKASEDEGEISSKATTELVASHLCYPLLETPQLLDIPHTDISPLVEDIHDNSDLVALPAAETLFASEPSLLEHQAPSTAPNPALGALCQALQACFALSTVHKVA